MRRSCEINYAQENICYVLFLKPIKLTVTGNIDPLQNIINFLSVFIVEIS